MGSVGLTQGPRSHGVRCQRHRRLSRQPPLLSFLGAAAAAVALVLLVLSAAGFPLLADGSSAFCHGALAHASRCLLPTHIEPGLTQLHVQPSSAAVAAPPAAPGVEEPLPLSLAVPELTYYGLNGFSLQSGGKRLLVDPAITADLSFFGQRWAFVAERLEEAKAAAPDPALVHEQFDAVVLTQGLEDHAHPPTLKVIDRRTPIIACPTAAEVVRELGFKSVTTLQPGDKMQLGPFLEITAVPGSVVGPPWQAPENGYVFTDTRTGGLAVGYEPHGNFLGPALGTSFLRLPTPPPVKVDALFMPLTSQSLSGYQLVRGAKEAIETLEALDPPPRFVLPLKNAEIRASGALAEAVAEEGSPAEFQQLLQGSPKLRGTQLLDVVPGVPVRLE